MAMGAPLPRDAALGHATHDMSHANQQPHHRSDSFPIDRDHNSGRRAPATFLPHVVHGHDHHPMTPSSATTTRRRRRRCNRNAASVSVSARALAAGLWRLRHAQRMKTPAQAKLKGRRRHHGRTHVFGAGIGSHCRQCSSSIHQQHRRGILDKVELELPPPTMSAMERATKWDLQGLQHPHPHRRSTPPHPPLLLLMMEAELKQARSHISELQEERRFMASRLERFLRKLAEDKARARDKARHAVAALREERAHRRQLEQANARLMRDLAEARSSGKQQAQSYEMERRARELMEEACSELTREVEEDQAEVELLRRECLRMREEMEEERRMLQMAEVWREERVQMKLSDAKLALETKYSQLSRLQAEMEAFLRSKQGSSPATRAAASSSLRSRGRSSQQPNKDEVDAESVLEHFRRKEQQEEQQEEEREDDDDDIDSNNNSNLLSPATDLFLAKVDDNGGSSSADMDYDGGRDSCSWFGTSDRSASVANGSGLLHHSSGASRRSISAGKNTALIRRIWRSAIAESRNKTGGGWSPSSDRRSGVTAEAPAPQPQPQPQQGGKHKQSLREKLMEARRDDRKPHAVKRKT